MAKKKIQYEIERLGLDPTMPHSIEKIGSLGSPVPIISVTTMSPSTTQTSPQFTFQEVKKENTIVETKNEEVDVKVSEKELEVQVSVEKNEELSTTENSGMVQQSGGIIRRQIGAVKKLGRPKKS